MKKTCLASLLCSLFLTFILCIISSPLFAECIEGDCENGSGTCLFPGGSKYIGEWEDGQMNGKGKFIFSTGAKYNGEWQKGELIRYTNLETPQKRKVAVSEKQNIDIEKRLQDTNFDPTTELPVTAAGDASKTKK